MSTILGLDPLAALLCVLMIGTWVLLAYALLMDSGSDDDGEEPPPDDPEPIDWARLERQFDNTPV